MKILNDIIDSSVHHIFKTAATPTMILLFAQISAEESI
jgi:hypothetical protein